MTGRSGMDRQHSEYRNMTKNCFMISCGKHLLRKRPSWWEIRGLCACCPVRSPCCHAYWLAQESRPPPSFHPVLFYFTVSYSSIRFLTLLIWLFITPSLILTLHTISIYRYIQMCLYCVCLCVWKCEICHLSVFDNDHMFKGTHTETVTENRANTLNKVWAKRMNDGTTSYL